LKQQIIPTASSRREVLCREDLQVFLHVAKISEEMEEINGEALSVKYAPVKLLLPADPSNPFNEAR